MTKELLMMLIEAICFVESGCNPHAIGDNGKAWGCMQIHECVIFDVNRHYGTTYNHEDVFDPQVSYKVFSLYTKMWGDHLMIREGRKPTLEDLARIWNGGPQGYKKEATKKYWAKVKSILDQMVIEEAPPSVIRLSSL